jgi:pimeloyl-ACP methyl ester carboxylesterase
MDQRLQDLLTEERLQRGYVIILPGIEGRSFFNRSIARGLADAGVPYGIEIDDWTWKWPLMLYNLRSSRLHRQQAARIAAKIEEYRAGHPEQPVYLIGHSGGAALSVLTLERLSEATTVTGAVLLGCALSPRYALEAALRKTTRGIWNFTSLGDLLVIGLGTLLFGTIDGKLSVSAGVTGFRKPEHPEEPREKLREIPFRAEFVKSRNFAGHFGYTARPFVRRYIAPLLADPA